MRARVFLDLTPLAEGVGDALRLHAEHFKEKAPCELRESMYDQRSYPYDGAFVHAIEKACAVLTKAIDAGEVSSREVRAAEKALQGKVRHDPR